MHSPLPHPPQGKVTRDSFPVDWDSKMRLAEQLREEAGPCPDHIFLILKVRRPPEPHMKSTLAKRYVCTHGTILKYTKYEYEPGKSKWLAKENLEKMSHKTNSNCHETATQGLSESALVSIDTYCTLFFLVNTLRVSLLSIFVGIHFCRAEGPLSLITGLMARIWCFHCHDPASTSGQELKPCFKLLQAEATWDQGEFCPWE